MCSAEHAFCERVHCAAEVRSQRWDRVCTHLPQHTTGSLRTEGRRTYYCQLLYSIRYGYINTL